MFEIVSAIVVFATFIGGLSLLQNMSGKAAFVCISAYREKGDKV